MKTRRMMAILLAAALSVLCLAAMAGCAPSAETEDAASLNRAYMSKANTAMSQMNADLEPFTAAVAAGDIVTMEQAATNVYRDIDSFKRISAPDMMVEIHAEYCAGCDDLKNALQAYIAVFKDAEGADVSDINEVLGPVQQKYDSAIAHLQTADTLVTKLNGAMPSSSSSDGASTAASASSSSTASAAASASTAATGGDDAGSSFSASEATSSSSQG